jgi:hypothetical protein
MLAGCGKGRSRAPEWAASAPPSTVMAVSGRAGWLLEQPGFQAYLDKYPYAGQTLDLFLKKAHVAPSQDRGRISFYVMSVPGLPANGKAPEIPDFLIQLGGFKDQAAVHMAISDAFPTEGSLPVNKQELPVHVILDVNQYHIRAVADASGRVWLGDLRTLARLDAGALPPRHPALRAAEWTNREAPFQGFLQVKPILDGLAGRVPDDLARNLPKGVEALAWSVTPGNPGSGGLHRFELALTGNPEGILQVAPWVQRFVAAASAIQGAANAPAPEILQERDRIGVRCQLTGDQINQALGRLSQPAISFLSRKS